LYTSNTANDRRLKLISDCMAVDALYGSIVAQMLEPEQAARVHQSSFIKCWLMYRPVMCVVY